LKIRNPHRLNEGEIGVNRKYWDKEIETMTHDKLMDYQWEKLRRELDYVYNHSEFYKKKFKRAGLKPSNIKELDDLIKIPFTTKQELRESQAENPPFGFHLAAPVTKVVRVHSTSGTTGTPLILALTKHDLEVWDKCAFKVLWAAGIRPEDIIINAYAMCMFTAGLSKCTGGENFGAAVVPAGAESGTEKILRLIDLIRPSVLWCTPSFAEYLGESAPRVINKEAKDLGLRIIDGGGEPGYSLPHVREKIEAIWNVKAHDCAGIGDMCTNIWGTCYRQDGLHFMAHEHIYYELISPDTNEIINLDSNGIYEGELVYSHMDREAGPLIRFRTRDYVEINTWLCECGRTGYRVTYKGRTDDMLIVKGVNVFPSAVKDVVSKFIPETTGNIRIVVSKDEPLPRVTPP
jgi:phenylacetate-CoA ligase